MTDKNIIAFVHAKSTSQRVKNKNMRMLGNKHLFCHAISNAKDCKLINKVVIDSDAEEILQIGRTFGAEMLKRPSRLATNEATGDDLMYWQAQNYPTSDIVLQVIPTSPFIQSSTIEQAITVILEKNCDSVVGVYSEAFYEWYDGKPSYLRNDGTIPNSFELKKTIYETTGLYINQTQFVLAQRKRINHDNCYLLQLSKLESLDINTEEDFEFAEIVWKGLHS